jgi:hypothetical protein
MSVDRLRAHWGFNADLRIMPTRGGTPQVRAVSEPRKSA